jgi:hypothetical protein
MRIAISKIGCDPEPESVAQIMSADSISDRQLEQKQID